MDDMYYVHEIGGKYNFLLQPTQSDLKHDLKFKLN